MYIYNDEDNAPMNEDIWFELIRKWQKEEQKDETMRTDSEIHG